MLFRFVLALIASSLPVSMVADEARYLGSYVWSVDDPSFGGFSALELSADGRQFYALSDRAVLYTGTVSRSDSGAVSVVKITEKNPLRAADGGKMPRYSDDAEGLALAADGTLFASFEAMHRAARLSPENGRVHDLKGHPDFKGFQNNSSLEALAVDAAGRLYTLPERSGAQDRPFPVYRRLVDGEWETFGSVSREGEFLPVGADFGPDGQFYLLERWFTGLGFASRVRRFDVGSDGFENGVELFRSFNASHDNLEGLAVWEDEAGVHLTMISDDNFRFFQRTEFVDYLVAK